MRDRWLADDNGQDACKKERKSNDVYGDHGFPDSGKSKVTLLLESSREF